MYVCVVSGAVQCKALSPGNPLTAMRHSGLARGFRVCVWKVWKHGRGLQRVAGVAAATTGADGRLLSVCASVWPVGCTIVPLRVCNAGPNTIPHLWVGLVGAAAVLVLDPRNLHLYRCLQKRPGCVV